MLPAAGRTFKKVLAYTLKEKSLFRLEQIYCMKKRNYSLLALSVLCAPITLSRISIPGNLNDGNMNKTVLQSV